MEAAEKISVTMTPEMLREIRASVAAGEYASTSEALRDAVHPAFQVGRGEDREDAGRPLHHRSGECDHQR